MPVLGHSIGPQALVAFGVEVGQISFSACATHATETVGDYAGGLDESRAQQRDNGQEDAGGIATRCGNEPGLANGLTMQLRHTVNGLRQELGRGMCAFVKLFVYGRIVQAEVCGEVDDRAPGLQ